MDTILMCDWSGAATEITERLERAFDQSGIRSISLLTSDWSVNYSVPTALAQLKTQCKYIRSVTSIHEESLSKTKYLHAPLKHCKKPRQSSWFMFVISLKLTGQTLSKQNEPKRLISAQRKPIDKALSANGNQLSASLSTISKSLKSKLHFFRTNLRFYPFTWTHNHQLTAVHTWLRSWSVSRCSSLGLKQFWHLLLLKIFAWNFLHVFSFALDILFLFVRVSNPSNEKKTDSNNPDALSSDSWHGRHAKHDR